MAVVTMRSMTERLKSKPISNYEILRTLFLRVELIYRALFANLQQCLREALDSAWDRSARYWDLLAYGLARLMPARLNRLRHNEMDRLADANFQWLMRAPDGYCPRVLWKKKYHLEKAIYFHRAKKVAELRACAQKLERVAAEIRLSGRPVIFAPLHTLSDVTSVLVVGSMRGHATAISSHGQCDLLGPREAESLIGLKINLKQLDPLAMSSREFKASIQSIKENRTNFILFPDILPEITFRLNRKSMRTYDCTLFGRPAKLHSGLNDIARLSGATALFFCLIEKDGRLDLDILAPVPAAQLTEEAPRVIEAAIRKHAKYWLLWHSPSLFYFNPSDH